MHKLYSCYFVLIFINILVYLFFISDKNKYVKTNTNTHLANKILQNKPQSNAVLYSRKRNLKYLEKFPNVPFQFLYEMKNNTGHHCYNYGENKNIIYNERNIKTIFNITINNQYWQEYISTSGIFYLYNAYLDTRGKDTLIRIPAIVENSAKNVILRCAIWYKKSADPDISVVPIEIIPIYRQKTARDRRQTKVFTGIPFLNNMYLYLLTCKIPYKRERIPLAISIVDNNGTHIDKKPNCYETANYLKVNHNNEK